MEIAPQNTHKKRIDLQCLSKKHSEQQQKIANKQWKKFGLAVFHLRKIFAKCTFFVFPIVTLLNLSFDAKLIGNEITSTKTAHLKALQMNELYECTTHTKKHLAKIKTEN